MTPTNVSHAAKRPLLHILAAYDAVPAIQEPGSNVVDTLADMDMHRVLGHPPSSLA
jgi:hypothetical protein